MLLVQQHPLQGIAIQEMQYALVLGPSIGTMQFHIRRTGDLFSIKIFSVTFFFVTITQVLVQTYTTRGKQQWRHWSSSFLIFFLKMIFVRHFFESLGQGQTIPTYIGFISWVIQTMLVTILLTLLICIGEYSGKC